MSIQSLQMSIQSLQMSIQSLQMSIQSLQMSIQSLQMSIQSIQRSPKSALPSEGKIQSAYQAYCLKILESVKHSFRLQSLPNLMLSELIPIKHTFKLKPVLQLLCNRHTSEARFYKTHCIAYDNSSLNDVS